MAALYGIAISVSSVCEREFLRYVGEVSNVNFTGGNHYAEGFNDIDGSVVLRGYFELRG